MADNIGTKLEDIQFPEFTANLIGSTFDALISANLRQMTAHAELVDRFKEDISTFINNTEDDITGDEALAFLERVLPSSESATDSTLVQSGATLSATQAAQLTKKLALPSEAGVPPTEVEEGVLTETSMDTILNAVVKRLAFNKYDMLQKMVNQGLLRIVIEKGEIESRLDFSAWEHKDSTRTTTDYQRSTQRSRKKGKRGIFASVFLGSNSGSTTTTKLHVSTNNAKTTDFDETKTNVTGSVKLYFKTDYMPLDQEDE